MKKGLAIFVAIVMLSTMLFSTTAFAASTNAIKYYDADGNEITVNGLFYNSAGIPTFNASSYYTDANGNPVYVGGGRCYYYNRSGNLVAGNYYYDVNGNAISNSRSGWGCGMWYYNAQGSVVNTTTYYDDFGNPVDPPANPAPSNPGNYGYGCGCGCWGGRGWNQSRTRW